MAKQGTILIVDDNKGILQALKILLSQYFENIITITTPNLIDSKIRDNIIDVVLLDMNFVAKINSGNEGLYWLNHIKENYPSIPVIVFTAYADIELAVEAVKRGATDFLVKPWDNNKLVATLTNAYNLRKSQSQIKQLKEIKQELLNGKQMWWGESKIMRDLKKTIQKVAVTNANILITGENGTGKEMLSREIHRLSKRNNELMVTVDMGSIVESLFESELFGHVKGSFTDAKTDRAGKFEVANNGTLFLDEIGNIPVHLQSKLLVAIQNSSITRVGSNTPIPINIRLICATNKDLNQMVKDQTFRQDLLYRINTIHIHLPSLRERKEDIPAFANNFLKQYSLKYSKPEIKFTTQAISCMEQYNWPGNIRELEHAIEKAVILSEDNLIKPESLMLTNNETTSTFPNEIQTLDEMEKALIKNAIEKYSGNLTAVATQLNITRQTLYNKIKKYGL
jgi:Response regulator containing CheY-like receiver, AAA-type ATPase, and DNA-binding domains